MNSPETKKRKKLPFEDSPVAVRRAVTAVALLAAGSGAYVAQEAAHNALDSLNPQFHGEHTVTITENNVTDIAKDHVEGANKDIRATVDKIVRMNPDVFQDGKAFVDSEDIGKTITVPVSLEK